VQRDETPGVDNDKTVTGGASGTAGAITKGKTTNIIFSADYHEVPGKGRDRVTPRETDDALWFDPLAVHSNVPRVDDTKHSKGVVSGAGQQEIGTFAVPVTEGDLPVGIGTVTPALRFADSLNASFDVTIDLPAGTKGEVAAEANARKAAKRFLEDTMPLLGDVDALEARTVDHLSEKGFSGAKVKISIKKSKTTEVGQSTFFYRARNNPAILMEILAQPVGEKSSSRSETVSKNEALETESERHGERSIETVDITYAKLVVDTLTDYVRRIDDARTELISVLSDKIVDDATYSKDVREKEHKVEKKTDDLTKKVTSHTESGTKDKKNWAERLKGPLGWLKKATRIPFADKIPFLRRVRQWQLDLFAVKGKVDYSDTTEDTTEKRKKGGTEDTTRSEDIDIKSNSKHDQKRELVEKTKSHSESEYRQFKQRVESTKEEYSKVTRKESGGGSDRVKESSGSATTVTFSGVTTWKFTKPQVRATVVSGDGEVSDKSFKEQS
jgi:hypothetical protein